MKKKASLYLAAFFLAPLLCLAGTAMVQQGMDLQSRQALTAEQTTLIARIKGILTRKEEEIRDLSPRIESLLGSPDKASLFLRGYGHGSSFRYILIFSQEGEALAEGGKEPPPLSFRNRISSEVRKLAAPPSPRSPGQPAAQPVPVQSIPMKDSPDGKMKGVVFLTGSHAGKNPYVITALFPMGDLQTILDYFTTKTGGYAWIVDDRGEFVLFPRRQRLLAPTELLADAEEGKKLLGEAPVIRKTGTAPQKFISSAAVDFLGWHLVLASPIPQVFPLVNPYLYLLLCLGGGLLGILLVDPLVRKREKLHLALQSLRDTMAKSAEPPPSLREVPEAMAILDQYRHLLGSYQEVLERDLDISPVTGLPGNVALQKTLYSLIDSGQTYAVGFLDSNNFSSYNLKYGFERGDRILRMTSTILRNMVKEKGTPTDFIGHLGGDHFVFVTSVDHVDAICQGIIKEFDGEIKKFYEEDDLKRGFTVSKDRQGNVQVFPVMTVSIAVVTNQHRPLIHPLQVGQIAGELRNYLRKVGTSYYLKDRRKDDRGEDLGQLQG